MSANDGKRKSPDPPAAADAQESPPHTRVSTVTLLAVAVIVVATLAAFWPTLENEFVAWDDFESLVDNPHYRGLGAEQVRWMFTTYHMGVYQPLSWFVYGVEYLIFGERAWGYHLTGLLLHVLCTLVFFDVASHLLRLAMSSRKAGSDGPSILGATTATLLFAIHPLRVETVAWATGQPYVLCCLMYLLAVRSYLTAHGGGGRARARRSWLAVSFVFSAAAMLSLGIAVSLPIVLLVLDVYPLRRISLAWRDWHAPTTWRVVLEKSPFLVLALATATIGVNATTFMTEVSDLRALDGIEKLAIRGYALAFYLRKTVVPVGLSPFYPLPADFSAGQPQYVASGAVFLAFALALFLLRRRWPAGLAVLACYVASLAPVLGVVVHGSHVAADRYTLLACMGWAVLAGGAVARLMKTDTWKGGSVWRFCVIPGAVAVACVALGALTWRQVLVWRDSNALWSHAVAISSPNATISYNMGNALLERGETAEARERFAETVRLKPDYVKAHVNLGIALARLGQTAQAIEAFRDAIRIDPLQLDAHLNLAVALHTQGELDEAIAALRAGLRISPEDAQAQRYLAFFLLKQGKVGEAIEAHRQALRLQPGDAHTRSNLGLLLYQQGQVGEAIREYRAALRSDPGNPDAHYNLGCALADRGQLEQAVEQFRNVLEIDPDYPGAREKLDAALSKPGRP